jgi:hypothetical protein
MEDYNQLKFKRRVIYNLKRRYSKTVDLYQLVTISDDVKTGQTTKTKTKIHIKKAIFLPINTTGLINLVGAYRVVNNTYPSSEIGVNTSILIIDNKDLPNGVVINKDNYVVINHVRYDILKFDSDKYTSVLTITSMNTSQRNEIFDNDIQERLVLIQRLSN